MSFYTTFWQVFNKKECIISSCVSYVWISSRSVKGKLFLMDFKNVIGHRLWLVNDGKFEIQCGSEFWGWMYLGRPMAGYKRRLGQQVARPWSRPLELTRSRGPSSCSKFSWICLKKIRCILFAKKKAKRCVVWPFCRRVYHWFYRVYLIKLD